MKTMKKIIAISLTVVMLVALAIPANAWAWYNTGRTSDNANTSNRIATEQQELTINAGKLPADATVTLNAETSDADWQYAYPYTLNKKYTPGKYDGVADTDVYLMYDNEYIYVKEVRRGTLRDAKQYSEYMFILSNVQMSTSSKTPVGARVKVTSPFTTGTTSGIVANTIDYQQTTNFRYLADGATGDMQSTTNFTGVESYSRYIDANCFEIETKIPLSKIGGGLTNPEVGTLLGFKHYTYFGTGSATYQTVNLYNTGYHMAWDYYAPLYLRSENAEASTYVIDTTWYNANETEFVLTTAGQLLGLAGLINSAADLNAARAVTSGKTFKLGTNIYLNPVSNSNVPYYYWTPMVTFDGTLDGQGYGIYGMNYHYAWNTSTMVGKNYDSCSRDAGFISHIYGAATIKNLIFADAKVVSNWAGGALLGKAWDAADATFENIYLQADVSVSNGANTNQDCGIFCGRLNTGAKLNIKNMVVTGSASMTTTGGNYAGPLWGRGSGAATTVTDVMVINAKITSTGSVTWGSYHGGNDKANKTDYLRIDGGKLYDLTHSPDTWNKKEISEYPADWINADEAQANVKMPIPVAEMISRNLWIQGTDVADGKFSVRILSVIDSIEWDKLGLKVEMKVGDGEFTDISADIPDADAVYTSVLAAGVHVDANKLGGKYISGVVLTNISATETVTFKVTPIKYVGETAYVNAHASTVTYVNGVLQK